MISENDKIQPGIMKLQPFARPPLVAGDYKVSAGVLVKGIEKDNADYSYTDDSLQFTVSAPRLSLDLSLIYGVYPLPGSTGAYHTTLPHVVLSRKTLPWERTIDTAKNLNPWLCLLLLTAGEIDQNKVSVVDIAAKDLTNTNGDANLIVPQIDLEPWEDNADKVKVLEMPIGLYNSISPKASELSYLAHTRQVDMSAKSSDADNPKGWFAVLVCNRLPLRGADNNVFLVSLEGHPDSQKQQPVSSRIRLVVLNQWSFQEAGATFGELADNLLENIQPLRLETDTVKPLLPGVTNALNYGYVPLKHALRNGQTIASWYRGPLVPVNVPVPSTNLYQYLSADQCLRFDTAMGMFDISYSAAWQLGRLLALKNAGYATALNNWTSSFIKAQALNAATAILTETGNGVDIPADQLEAMTHTVASDEVLTDVIIELWNQI
jgi:hypothetical protein